MNPGVYWTHADNHNPNTLYAIDLSGKVLATYNNARDLIDIGAYAHGSNPRIDEAIRLLPYATAFLRQAPREVNFERLTIKSPVRNVIL